GGEVGDAAAGHGEALADRGGRVLTLRLEEHERVAPEVLVAVHDGGVEAAAHGGRAGDRVGPCRLGDVDLDVDDGLRAVAGGRDPRVLELLAVLLVKRLGDLPRLSDRRNAHQSPLSYVRWVRLRSVSRGWRPRQGCGVGSAVLPFSWR